MIITDQKNLINQAEKDLNESNQLLEEFKRGWNQTSDHPLNDPDVVRTMQLVLQYRLDTQKALYQLSGLQQYLLQLLGIEPQHSDLLNRERLAFALGSDDLQHVLSMLNHLVDSLLRIIAHNHLNQILDKKKSLERSKNLKLIDVMIKVIDKQKTFVSKMEELKLALEDIEGAPQPGIIYDHIAALQGPVSRFYQALQHGLALNHSLTQQPQNKANLQYQLKDTLQSVDQNLKIFNYNPSQQRLFKPAAENNKIENLEVRASAKRLGHFFNH
ncbi:hypothetical protein [Legionella quateirensis]|uniref:Uncharacterized protein n=1 Tax=Legionella quateirensis TaxID=45072 RepID=A0A378KUG6_9GAMM|nr:hypothetical protein [Legionella quateirensis]KTD44843.1 hypothetical protein Lqua_2678 [Legionella quateirensis]STY17251.1 Uncharacterised protein [Legionella quateirensis]